MKEKVAYLLINTQSDSNLLSVMTRVKEIYNNETHTYTNNTYPKYIFLCDGKINDEEDNYTSTNDYNVFFELLHKLITNSNFYINQEYLAYNAFNLVLEPGAFISFKRNDIVWKIYLNINRLLAEYKFKRKMLVFFDEDHNIESLEMFPTMTWFQEKLGKENKYDGVYKYTYMDPLNTYYFYVFYQNPVPSKKEVENAIRDYVIERYTYPIAKKKFPNLFIDMYRNIYPMWHNTCTPINYELASLYINQYTIYRPEILLLLDFDVPLICEHGVSDVVPNYSPIQTNDLDSNKFIYFLSKILHYMFHGSVLTANFKIESNFDENADSCSFLFKNIQWVVFKQKNVQWDG